MPKSASKIRSVMAQVNYFQGLMVSAMSGKTVEFRRPSARLHKDKVFLPALGRQIVVIKKINLGEEVSRQRVAQSVASLRLGVTDGINGRNYQTGGTRIEIRKYHPLGDEKLSSQERGIVDHKRQRRFPKGEKTLKAGEF